MNDLNQVAGGAESRPSGMPCPQCGGFIPFSMQEMVTQSYIVCPHCGLRLNINQQECRPAIEALMRWEEMKKKFDEQQQKTQ